ncbi:GNAT family N-acetyltransferase [Vallitalea okinawensis]|uniref:GNAT family N-acetyltransferase n=1 Tax=Vallitalea okinawensis TaxID=2078660 RepID=UPI0014787882|nr:GNAT family N-acetyltransferase [Vallitalea okinawensis]
MKEMETNRLKLRRFVPQDWEDLYEYLSDPDVVLFEPYDVFTKEECIDEAIRRSEGEPNHFWAVCLKENEKMIGHVYFAQKEPYEFKTWMIGYVFNPSFYGHGYATEASKRILEYGFNDKKAHRIIAGANVKNPASWRLLERLSMRREAHMIENAFFTTTTEGHPIWHDSYHYAILSSEYNKINDKL